MLVKNKIIAAFSSLEIEKNKSVVDIVASIIQYDKDIDFNHTLNFIDSLIYNNSNLLKKNKKFIVINIGMYKNIKDCVSINEKYLKVIDMNLISFLGRIAKTNNNNSVLNFDNFHFNKLGEKMIKEYNSKLTDYNIKLLRNFNYLFKLNIIDLFKDEEIFSIEKDYNLIFIFEGITLNK